MDLEKTLDLVNEMETRDGFSPADLLDFPSPIVSTLRYLMGRRKKKVSDLTTQLNLQDAELAILLEALAQKGLLIKSTKTAETEFAFAANLK